MARTDLLSDAEWLATVRERLRADGDAVADGELRLLSVRPSAAKGQYAGFIADSLPVRARVQLSDGNERDVAFFIKTVPTDSDAQMRMAPEAFTKEVGVYSKLFPRMRGLPPRSKTAPGTSPWAPRIFFTRSDLLVMEDLIEQGFLERHRREPFDFEHAAITLEALGRFHASSILLEEELKRETGRPSLLNQMFPEFLEELLFVVTPKNLIGEWFGSAVRTLHGVVGTIPKYKSSVDCRKIVDIFPVVEKKMSELTRPSTKYRNVLNHGDLWSNNILFKYSEDAQPIDVRLVDFQCTRYCPPAVDIVTLLHLTTRPALRRERGGELLQRYHASLADSLLRGGTDVQRILPWHELVISCDEYHDAGRIISPSYHHLSLINPEILKDQLSPENFEIFFFRDRHEVVKRCFQDDKYYSQKVTEELCELVDGVILGEDAGFWKRVTANVDRC